MSASRRTPSSRRPRVAGLHSRNTATAPTHPEGALIAPAGRAAADTGRPGHGRAAAVPQRGAGPAGTAAGTGRQTTIRDTGHETAAPDDQGSRGSARRGGVATLVALLAVFLVAATLAVWFRGEAEGLRSRADTNNTALVDGQATAQVDKQISAALETVYSYDFSRLDADEAAARKVVTGEFTEDYRALLAEVRELAPPQQAVVSAAVVNSAVKVLDGEHAVLVVFLNQQGTKGTTGEQIAASGRLRVTAQQVDGRWKIAAVQNL